MSNTLPLTTSFRKTIEKFKSHNSVGLIDTEHVIFIPAVQLQESDTESDSSAFMKLLGKINRKTEWGCPIDVSSTKIGSVEGLEIVIKFNKGTNYEKIGEFIDGFIHSSR